MKCFNHKDKDAVGVCKYCMKGICHECGVEIGNSLACVNSCEQKVELINAGQEKMPVIQRQAMAMRILGPIFVIAYGLYLIAYWSGIGSEHVDFGLVGLGAICAAFGIGLLVKNYVRNRH